MTPANVDPVGRTPEELQILGSMPHKEQDMRVGVKLKPTRKVVYIYLGG